MFGISGENVINKNKVKVLDSIAGSGKSTTSVQTCRQLGLNFILLSFSNALKFASEKFNCPTDTICGTCFVNTPFPRSEEKEVIDYDTVIIDEVLLDGVDTIRWIKSHRGQVNIIVLTDSHQMLQAENSHQVLKEFQSLIDDPDTIYVNITETKRAVDDETRTAYTNLYNTDSNKLFTLSKAAELLHADIMSIDDIDFNPNNAYICHSNLIEHELYKRYDLSNRRDVPLIPKNHIARKKDFDASRYPICDQMTATDKKIQSYLETANVASPTRFQGKEVSPDAECYFIVSSSSIFTGRELYTVATRCKSISSLHIVIFDIETYNDPDYLCGRPVVYPKHLNIPEADKKYECVTQQGMASLLKKYGVEGEYYYSDYITSGDNIIYSTLSNSLLERFSSVKGDEVIFEKKHIKRSRSIKSVTKKDTTMHFDFMPRVYELANGIVTPPRFHNTAKSKKQFTYLADIFSAFPTILAHAPIPKAGFLYNAYDPDLLNFYRYNGDVVTTGSIITESLANKLGNADYLFSTAKQTGCELGRHTYAECHKSKEHKQKINENFLWGTLESDYYKGESVIRDGKMINAYIKCEDNNLELVACALWSELCLIMMNAAESINLTSFYVVTDGLYYNTDTPDVRPVFPSYVDYRIEKKDWSEETDPNEKYKHIIYQTYADLPETANASKCRTYYRKKQVQAPEVKSFEEELRAALSEDIH